MRILPKVKRQRFTDQTSGIRSLRLIRLVLAKFRSLRAVLVFHRRRLRGCLSGERLIWGTMEGASYEEYVRFQMEKTSDPRRRALWLNEEWEPKIQALTEYFRQLSTALPGHWKMARETTNHLALTQTYNALCIGARTGQEVQSLRDLGWNAVGVDLVPCPPLVLQGDLHRLDFGDATMCLTFSNILDHALYPEIMISEMERVTAPNGLIVLHLTIGKPTDEYGVTEIGNARAVTNLFKASKIIVSHKMPTLLAMNWEIIAQRIGGRNTS